MMDEASKRALDAILVKSPEVLTSHEKAVVRARQSYLSEYQLQVFADVLSEEEQVSAAEEAPAQSAEGSLTPEAEERSEPAEAPVESVEEPTAPEAEPAPKKTGKGKSAPKK